MSRPRGYPTLRRHRTHKVGVVRLSGVDYAPRQEKDYERKDRDQVSFERSILIWQNDVKRQVDGDVDGK